MRSSILAGLSAVLLIEACLAGAPRAARIRSEQPLQDEGAEIYYARPGEVISKAALPALQIAVVNDAGTQVPPAINVLSSLDLGDDQQLYENMATVLSGIAVVPNDRATFGSALAGSITGWVGSVSNVVADGNGGYFVTVLIAPIVALNGGATPTPMANYSEQWDVDANNNPTFI